jgi:hypothetical protein
VRLLYVGIEARTGELEVTAPSPSKLVPGKAKVIGCLSRSASIHSLLCDLINSTPGLHVYLLARFSPGDWSPGLYVDEDQERLTWLLVPTTECSFDTGVAAAFGLDGHLKLFQDNAKLACLPIDAVLGVVPFLARRTSLQLSSSKRVVPGVVRHESSYGPTGNVVESWGRPGGDSDVAERVTAESLGIHHVFLSEKDRMHYFSLFIRPFLSAAAHRRLSDRTVVIRNGIDFVTLDRWVDEWGGPVQERGRSVGSFSRPMAQKGTPDTLELYAKMAIAGQVDKVRVTWNRPTPLTDLLPSVPEQFEFYPNSSRKDYLKQAARTSCAIFASTNESSPFSLIECAALGCAPILPDREWVRSLAEPWPLVFRSWDEAPKLVMMVLEEREKWSAFARGYARRLYDVRDLGARFVQHVDGLARQTNLIDQIDDFGAWTKDSKLAARIDELFDGREEVTWLELSKAQLIPRDTMGQPSIITHHDLPRLIEKRTGFVDDVSSPVPVFRRAQSTA